MDAVLITIIGAGVVGQAIAAGLANSRRDIVVLEKNAATGQETSSRNSEVVHAGLHYPPNSLKSVLCIEGNGLIYGLFERGLFKAKKLGKLIIATDPNEVLALQGIHKNALAAGVADLELLDGDGARRLEPALKAVAALYSPNTGIVDSHGLMEYLAAKARNGGAKLVTNSAVDLLEKTTGGFIVGINGGEYRFHSRIVINAAGLYADRVAALAGIDISQAGLKLKWCKGDYFAYGKRSPVSRVVYPVPHRDAHVLGIHATLDLGGRLRFGPDAEYVDTIDYRIAPGEKEAFAEAAKKLIPSLEAEHFHPDTSGIRPRLQGPGEDFRDFVIAEESARGLPGLINLIGIESPGLTASLAIGNLVGRMVDDFCS